MQRDPDVHDEQNRRDAVHEDVAEWAVRKAGVVGNGSSEAGEKGCERMLSQKEDYGDGRPNEQGSGGAEGVRQPA